MSIQNRWTLLKSADSLAEAECLKCCWDGSFPMSALRRPHFTLCQSSHAMTLPSLNRQSTADGAFCHNMVEWYAHAACSQVSHWSWRLLNDHREFRLQTTLVVSQLPESMTGLVTFLLLPLWGVNSGGISRDGLTISILSTIPTGAHINPYSGFLHMRCTEKNMFIFSHGLTWNSYPMLMSGIILWQIVFKSRM